MEPNFFIYGLAFYGMVGLISKFTTMFMDFIEKLYETKKKPDTTDFIERCRYR